MTNSVAVFKKEIDRIKIDLSDDFANNQTFDNFIEALREIYNLAQKQSYLSIYYTPNSSSPLNFIIQLLPRLAQVKSKETFEQFLPNLTLQCEEYKKLPNVETPLLKALEILAITATILIAGIILGAAFGFVALGALGVFAGSSSIASCCLLLGIAGSMVGAGAGLGAGAELGYKVACDEAGANFLSITTTLFFSEKHAALSKKVNELKNANESLKNPTLPTI